MRFPLLCLSLVSLRAPEAQVSPQARPIVVSRTDGGSIATDLGYDIVVNKGSSLHRQALTLTDQRLPVAIKGDAVVTTVYGQRDYYFKTSFSIAPKQDLSAIEVRFMLFDVFGDFMKTLSVTEVVDMKAAAETKLEGRWSSLENEVSEYFASLAFVARARTTSGQVVDADLSPVLAEAQKFARRLTVADLTPKPPSRP